MNFSWRSGLIAVSFFWVSVHQSASADFVVTDWISFNSNSAVGELEGIGIQGTRFSGGSFTDIGVGHFSTPGAWNAPMPLPAGTEGMVMQPINAGAHHLFEYEQPFASILFYIDNYDSFSDALVTAEGATSIEILAATNNIFYEPITASSGRLWTSNGGFDGNADVALKIDGDVESIRMEYTNGIQNNGIVYTFATQLTLGDVNCDMSVDLLDVAPFVDLVVSGRYLNKADINQDGNVDLLDVQPFVKLLTSD